MILTNFIGGEVTYYDINKLITIFNKNLSKKLSFQIVTNFSQSLNYFKQLYETCHKFNNKLKISCSYHSENLNFIEKFEELHNWCTTNNYTTPQANFIIDENTTKDELAVLASYILEKNWHIFLQEKTLSFGDFIRLIEEEKTKFNANKIIIKDKILLFNKLIGKEELPKDNYSYIILTDEGALKCSSVQAVLNHVDLKSLWDRTFYCDAAIHSIIIDPDDTMYYENCSNFFNVKTSINTKELLEPDWYKCIYESNTKFCKFCTSHSLIDSDYLEEKLNEKEN